MPSRETYWPLFDLRVRTPRLELRYPDDDLVMELAALAASGIHDPDFMPFSIPWTDAPSPDLERNSLQFYWRGRAGWSADAWDLPMATIVEAEIVGSQGVGAHHFAKTKTVATGSWLGKSHQGKGFGKEMRAAVLHLAFAGLGAARAESGAWEDNAPSLGVSRSLGYEENGDAIDMRRGEAGRQIRLLLIRERWEAQRRDDIEIIGLDPCRPMFGAV